MIKKHGLGIVSVALSTILGLWLIPGEPSTDAADAPMATIEAVDIALDFVPCVNTVKDLLCLGLGVNPVTGERVDEAEAAMLVGWLTIPWAARRANQAAGSRPLKLWQRLLARARRVMRVPRRLRA